MNLWILALALLCSLILSATAVSRFALWRAHTLLKGANLQPSPADNSDDGSVRALRESVESLAARLRTLELQPSQPSAPAR